MFGPAGDGAGAFFSNFLFDGGVAGSDVDGLRLGWFGNVPVEVGVGGDELGFAGVPSFEDGGGRCAAQDARVNEAGEADAGDVAGGAVYAFEVPNCLCSGEELVWRGEKGKETRARRTVWGRSRRGSPELVSNQHIGSRKSGYFSNRTYAPILFGEDSSEAPRLLLQWLHILDVDQQDITWLGIFDLKGSRQVVNPGEIHITHVIGGVIVSNLSSSPIDALNFDSLVVPDLAVAGDCTVLGASRGQGGGSKLTVWVPAILAIVTSAVSGGDGVLNHCSRPSR